MIKYKEENIIPANPDILIVFNNINEKYIKPFSLSNGTEMILNSNLKSANTEKLLDTLEQKDNNILKYVDDMGHDELKELDLDEIKNAIGETLSKYFN